jgi:hypothetical protein
MLNQFPRNSRHVSRLPCKDVPIFLEEFDEHEFLFGIETVTYVSHHRRFLHGQRDCVAECVLQLDGCLGSLGLGHDWVRGELGQGLLPLLELYRCQQSISSLIALSVIVESPIDISPDGDDTTWPWHLQDKIGIVQDCHELRERRKVTGVFPSAKGYGKDDLANRDCCCPRDYAVEASLTMTQRGSG